jgi:hypothetical protein
VDEPTSSASSASPISAISSCPPVPPPRSAAVEVLPWCYRGVTVVLPWCYSGVTVVVIVVATVAVEEAVKGLAGWCHAQQGWRCVWGVVFVCVLVCVCTIDMRGQPAVVSHP